MYAIQLDFFEDETETLRKEVIEARKMADNVRKALFARHNELAKEIRELQERLIIIERNLCNGGYNKM